MKMLAAVLISILCCFAGTVGCEPSLEIMSVNGNQSCAPTETECPGGCCPYPNATCCVDMCCPYGEICPPFLDICIGAINHNGQVSLTSTTSTPLKRSSLKCPAGTTECKPHSCCRFKNAVCCADGEHCCPNDYTCDIPSKLCVKDTINAIGKDSDSISYYDKKHYRKMMEESLYKYCPDGGKCPANLNCCINDDGEWGCCPNPYVPEIPDEPPECCTTFDGDYVCCPGCTIFGCF